MRMDRKQQNMLKAFFREMRKRDDWWMVIKGIGSFVALMLVVLLCIPTEPDMSRGLLEEIKEDYYAVILSILSGHFWFGELFQYADHVSDFHTRYHSVRKLLEGLPIEKSQYGIYCMKKISFDCGITTVLVLLIRLNSALLAYGSVQPQDILVPLIYSFGLPMLIAGLDVSWECFMWSKS